MRAWFRLLAKLKFLRGSILDPVGYSTERKMERMLISEYTAILEEVDGTKSYWALAHPVGEKPDFHAADCFAATLA